MNIENEVHFDPLSVCRLFHSFTLQAHTQSMTPLCLTVCPLRVLAPPATPSPAGGHAVRCRPGHGIFINHKVSLHVW